MSWGPGYMYYHCPVCQKKFKYALDLIAELQDDFGKCPKCNIIGIYEKDGPRTIDDLQYEEVE